MHGVQVHGLGKAHYLWVRGAAGRMVERNRTTREGGGAQNFRRFQKGEFWTFPEGGDFGLDQFFSMFLKHSLFMFWGYLGYFSFFWSEQGEAKNFRRIARGEC